MFTRLLTSRRTLAISATLALAGGLLLVAGPTAPTAAAGELPTISGTVFMD